MSTSLGLPKLIPCLDISDPQYDGVVIVTDKVQKLKDNNLTSLAAAIEEYSKIDSACEKEVILINTDCVPSKRLIFAPTGPLNRDYDDVRRFADAAQKGMKRALQAGCRKPLLVRPPDNSFEKAGRVTQLGCLAALYVPIEIREDCPDRKSKAEVLGIWCNMIERVKQSIVLANALESGSYLVASSFIGGGENPVTITREESTGLLQVNWQTFSHNVRIVTRDIGGSDPERMAAPKVAQYVEEIFKGTVVKVTMEKDPAVLQKEYPLLSAVNRAASHVDRHRARLIFLEYVGEGEIEKTVFIVGKGVTYDTGGADIKAGGVMAGMHRDKCGAAAVAGFFKILAELKPKCIRVKGAMSMVRNSVGSDCYVADEIITSRAGVRIRVGNTDAEGRMAMADVLCQFKEEACSAVNPQLFTVATLTGHAIRAYGPEYSIIMDNGPAKKLNTSQDIQSAGDAWGDPFEISTIRREDYDFHRGKSEYEDVLQCNNAPSSATPRGHQSPAAFLIEASGLEKHGIDSDQALPYSHLDIAGSSGPFPGIPTGAPIVALAAHFVLPRC